MSPPFTLEEPPPDITCPPLPSSYRARKLPSVGLHLRPARESDRLTSQARARRSTAPVDRTVRPTEPRLDRLAARRRIRGGVLDGTRRQRQHCAAAAARARISVKETRRAGYIAAARVVRTATECVRFACVICGGTLWKPFGMSTLSMVDGQVGVYSG